MLDKFLSPNENSPLPNYDWVRRSSIPNMIRRKKGELLKMPETLMVPAIETRILFLRQQTQL